VVGAELAAQSVPVAVSRLDPELPLPSYAHDGDAGADLHAAVDVELKPGERALVPTGIAIALPPGCVGLVHPRSGLAAKLGVTVLNAPGTVDAGYRGEILVNLINHDPSQPALIRRGDRIAQLVVQRVERADFQEVTQLPPSARGSGGHGSTGGIAGFGAAPAGDVAGVERMDSPDRSHASQRPGTAGTEDRT
jgi:dUTP pyrophosphatase